MQTPRFTLIATLTDGFEVKLPHGYETIAAANRAAENYIRDYSDPCQVGARVAYVSVIDAQLVAQDDDRYDEFAYAPNSDRERFGGRA